MYNVQCIMYNAQFKKRKDYGFFDKQYRRNKLFTFLLRRLKKGFNVEY